MQKTKGLQLYIIVVGSIFCSPPSPHQINNLPHKKLLILLILAYYWLDLVILWSIFDKIWWIWAKIAPIPMENIIFLGNYLVNYNLVTSGQNFKIWNSAESFCSAESELRGSYLATPIFTKLCAPSGKY